MNELEEKKWLISRLDLLHHSIIEEFKVQSNRCEKFEQKITSSYVSMRNYCLSALGIFLTVFVGVNPIYNINMNIFSSILIGISVIGIIIFCIFSLIISKNKKVFDFFHVNFLEAISLYSFSHGFMITNMAILDNVTIKQALNYYTFSIVLNYAVFNKISKSSKKYAKKYRKCSVLKEMIVALSKVYEIDDIIVLPLYEKLDKKESLPVNILEFIEKNLKSVITQNKSKKN